MRRFQSAQPSHNETGSVVVAVIVKQIATLLFTINYSHSTG